MTAFNAVRFRVRAGQQQAFIAAHEGVNADWPGCRRMVLVRTGEQTFCVIGEWDNMAALAAARPQMIATLDTFRDKLEDLGNGLGLTDPVSGEAVVDTSMRGRSAG